MRRYFYFNFFCAAGTPAYECGTRIINVNPVVHITAVKHNSEKFPGSLRRILIIRGHFFAEKIPSKSFLNAR